MRWSKGWHTFIYACEAKGVVSVPAIVRCNNLIYEYGSTNVHWHVLEVPTCLFFVRGKKYPLVFICGKKCPLVFRLLMVKALFARDYRPESVLLFSHGNSIFLSQQISRSRAKILYSMGRCIGCVHLLLIYYQ